MVESKITVARRHDSLNIKEVMARTDENLAGRGTRLIAVLLDNVFWLAALIPGGAALNSAANSYPGGGEGSAFMLLALGFLGFVGVQIYLLITRGQTVGKMLVGIQIVDVDDETLVGAVRIIGLRGVLTGLIVAIPYLGLLFALGDVLFIFGERRRCLHDHFASTKVIQSKRSDDSEGNMAESSAETSLRESFAQAESQEQGPYGSENTQEFEQNTSSGNETVPTKLYEDVPPDEDSSESPEIDRDTDSLRRQQSVKERLNRLHDILSQDYTWRAKRHDFTQALPKSLEEFLKEGADLRDIRKIKLGESDAGQREDGKGAIPARQNEQTECPSRTTEKVEPSQTPKEKNSILVCDTYLEWCHSAGAMVDRYYMFERKLREVIDDVNVRPIYRDKRANGIRLRYDVDDISDEFWLVQAGRYRAVFPQPRDGNHFRTLDPLFDANGAENPKSLSAVKPAHVDLDGTSYQLKERGMVE